MWWWCELIAASRLTQLQKICRVKLQLHGFGSPVPSGFGDVLSLSQSGRVLVGGETEGYLFTWLEVHECLYNVTQKVYADKITNAIPLTAG